jgi:hypothetical protein
MTSRENQDLFFGGVIAIEALSGALRQRRTTVGELMQYDSIECGKAHGTVRQGLQ